MSGHHRSAAARTTSPRRHAIDDASHDHACVRVGLDGGGVARFDGEAIAVVFDLPRGAGARLGRLPGLPDEVHGHAGDLVADDVAGVPEVGLQAFDALARWVGQRGVDADVVRAGLIRSARAAVERAVAAVRNRPAGLAQRRAARRRAARHADIVRARLIHSARAAVERAVAAIALGAALGLKRRAGEGNAGLGAGAAIDEATAAVAVSAALDAERFAGGGRTGGQTGAAIDEAAAAVVVLATRRADRFATDGRAAAHAIEAAAGAGLGRLACAAFHDPTAAILM